jgi:imidazoleglycerol phosphate dehydratase HisB
LAKVDLLWLLTRGQSRLRRAVNMIDKLEKQLKRMEKAARVDLAIAPPTATRPRAHAAISDLASTLGPAIQEAIADQKVTEIDTSIPAFLQRKKLDPAAQQIADEQADIKRRKAAGRIAKMKAKKSGELSKMPLTGKAALDAIRNG